MSSDQTIQNTYKAIRSYLESRNISTNPDVCKVAFGDDDKRHRNPILGGTSANLSREERDALVQVWEVGGKYTIQLHRYNPQSLSCIALSDLVRLSKRILTSDQRQEITNSVATELTKEQLAAFVTEIETITTAKPRALG